MHLAHQSLEASQPVSAAAFEWRRECVRVWRVAVWDEGSNLKMAEQEQRAFFFQLSTSGGFHFCAH